MHMVFVYYVICGGCTLFFALWYMKKYWTEDLFDQLKKEGE